MQHPPCRRGNRTDLDPLGPDVEHAHHAADEGADGLEVEPADAPGPVHQQDDVRPGRGLTHRLCTRRDTEPSPPRPPPGGTVRPRGSEERTGGEEGCRSAWPPPPHRRRGRPGSCLAWS